MSSGPPTKRQRPNKSCTVCREKKTKCDRVKPICGTCMKRNQSNLCRYEGPEWSIKVGDQHFVPVKEGPKANTHQKLKQQQIRQPSIQKTVPGEHVLTPTERVRVESLISPNAGAAGAPPPTTAHSTPHSSILGDDGDDTIDFYKDSFEEPSVFAEGTLTWVSMLRKDIYSRALLLCFNKEKIIFTKIKNSQKEGNIFANKFMDEDDLNSKIPEYSYKKGRSILQSLKDALKDNTLNWLLIDKFFDSELYCTLPVLDRAEFTEQLTRIIGPMNSNIQLNITGKFQLATLGCLLMIMRFASLSLYNAGKPLPQPISPSDQYILNHPVTKEVVAVAKTCLEEVSIFKEPHLIIFQLNLLLQHYNFFAPEDCDCITASTITNLGPLLHSAISSGLNRDPTLSRPKYPNPNLLRRLWFLVEYLDYHQLMLVGYAPIINASFHDTQIPFLDHHDSALQYTINEAFHNRRHIDEFCQPLLMLILNVKKAPKVRDVLNQMKKLEEYVDKMPKYDEIQRIHSSTVIHRFQKLKLLNGASDSSALLFMIYYNFFLHYNDKKNSEKSLYYCLQLLKLSKYLFSSVHFFRPPEKANENFNLNHHFGAGILALPKIELCLHKVSEFMIALLGRIKVYKALVGMNIDDLRLELLDKIAKLILKILFFVIDAFANISDTYYHAWSTTKIQSFIVEKILHNREGRYDANSLSPVESEYVRVVDGLRTQDDGFFLYSDQELKQILKSLEIIDVASLGQSPSPERLLYDLNNYKSVNDQLWFDQIMFENLNPDDGRIATGNGVIDNNGNGGSTSFTDNPVPTNNLGASGANDHTVPEWDPFGLNSIADLEQMLHHTINDY